MVVSGQVRVEGVLPQAQLYFHKVTSSTKYLQAHCDFTVRLTMNRKYTCPILHTPLTTTKSPGNVFPGFVAIPHTCYSCWALK